MTLASTTPQRDCPSSHGVVTNFQQMMHLLRRRKALLALSCLTRHFDPAMDTLREQGGLQLLLRTAADSSDPRQQRCSSIGCCQSSVVVFEFRMLVTHQSIASRAAHLPSAQPLEIRSKCSPVMAEKKQSFAHAWELALQPGRFMKCDVHFMKGQI